jgi:hypothetical protein
MCQSQAPVQQQQANTELPEWAKPYAKDILAKGQALTDVNQNPYQQYNQSRVAGFSPMQQQAMQNAQGMSVAPQIGQGTAAAVGAGLGGVNVAGQANQYGFQNQVGGYMNPYLQMSLAPQLAEANRNYDISGTRQQAAATGAGAFGGSREAIMAAENERNRNTGLSSIIGQGYNTAFNNAQQQYNQNLQNQLQGYGLLGSSANALGQLGQNQYSQNMGINQLQNQYGTAQQNLAQTGLNNAYQDFQNQQNYPYKQLGFMSDMIRGLPLGQQSTTAMYQGAPTALQTVGALGMGAYGINQLTRAEGGSVHGYAGGGDIYDDSVTSQDNIEEIISTLNPQQLQNALRNAQARGDGETVAAITARLDTLSKQASMNKGIAGAMPQQMADGVVNAAGGGILAFNGENEEGSFVQIPQYAGDPVLYKKFGERAMSAIDAFSNVQAPKAYTPQEEEALDARSMERARKLIGPSPTAGIKAELEDLKTQSVEALRQGKGLAALAAMEGMLQPGGALRGFGRAGKNFAEAYAPAVRADQDLRKSTTLMNINLANAQRAENMGLGKEAMAYTNQAIAAKKEAGKAERELAEKEAKLNIDAAKAFRPPSKGSGGGAGSAKEFQFATDTYLPLVQANPKYENLPLKEQKAVAYGLYQSSRPGVTAGATVKSEEDANKAFTKMQLGSKARKAWEQRVATEYGGDADAARRAWIAQERGIALPNTIDTMISNRTAQPRPAPQQTRPASSPNVIKLD